MKPSNWQRPACAANRSNRLRKSFMAMNNGNNGQPKKVIGKAFRKVDARAKCNGQTRFADDIILPRMLFCKLLRSPVPHALIKRIDITRADRKSTRLNSSHVRISYAV